ncbi:MAG TPA: phosphoribosyltransferase [Acidimicrobiales bacterium]|nr:phosphoribosyltransferase [Acidimicrobiales bacterium]
MGHEQPLRFLDREEAGRELASRLARYADSSPVVLALPRGGVPVGAPVARALTAPLEVFVARKVGAPNQPELGIGAVAEGGVRVRDDDALRALEIDDDIFARLAAVEETELRRRVLRYRGARPFPDLSGRTAILVDDGLATGVTALAALRSLRRFVDALLVLAVPVAPPSTLRRLAPHADDLVCLLAPEPFAAVGYWYHDFHSVSDDEVLSLLGSG